MASLLRPISLHVQAQPTSPLKDPQTFKVMGQPVPRVDIPAKVTGGAAYVQDMRLPGMVHARVVRPPSYGAELVDYDSRRIEKMPGVIRVVRDGNFLAVVAEKEFLAVKAMHALAGRREVAGKREAAEPERSAQRADQIAVAGFCDLSRAAMPSVAGTKTIDATYTRPYQSHGSIGPSCAVAQFADGAMTVWTHTQGVYPDRQAIAEMLGMPPAERAPDPCRGLRLLRP